MNQSALISNSQFILYYLLISADGIVNDIEKQSFIKIVSKFGNFTKSYSESVFMGMHRFPKALNYKFAIENLKDLPDLKKTETIKILEELAGADGLFGKKELAFIDKVKIDFKIS